MKFEARAIHLRTADVKARREGVVEADQPPFGCPAERRQRSYVAVRPYYICAREPHHSSCCM